MLDLLLSTYNGSKFLSEQLDSLLNQTYQNFNILIRDDCSSDNTVNIIETYKNKFPQKFIIVPNHGRNLRSTNSFFELLKHSTSELIMFCDQDDVWNKDKIELTVKFYNENVENKDKPVLIHTALEVVNENLQPLQERTMSFNRGKSGEKKSLLWHIFQNDVTGCTVLINSAMRDIVNKIDFTKNKVIQHDWFLSQIASLSGLKYYMPIKTINYRQHSNNVFGAKKLTFMQRIILKIKHGTSYPFYDQSRTLLQTDIQSNYQVLSEFANLQNRNKMYRMFWHIKKRFFREGSLLKKIYQLCIC